MNKKRKYVIIFFVVTVIITIRLLLPVLLQKITNSKLSGISPYKGVVVDIDLRLFRGAYVIDSVYFIKTVDGIDNVFMAAKKVEIAIDNEALFDHGKIAADIFIASPVLNFTIKPDPDDPDSTIKQLGKGVQWFQFFKQLSPLNFNRLKIKDGEVNYINHATDPQTHLYMTDISLNAQNIQKYAEKDSSLAGELMMTGTLMNQGAFKLASDLDIGKKPPNVEADIELKNVELVEINSILRRHTGLDFEKGTLNCYSELNLIDQQLDGYLKIVLNNMKLVDSGSEKGSLLDKAWERTAGAAADIFKNEKTNELATKIPINGNISNVKINKTAAIWNIYKNAFVDAFEQQVNISSSTNK